MKTRLSFLTYTLVLALAFLTTQKVYAQDSSLVFTQIKVMDFKDVKSFKVDELHQLYISTPQTLLKVDSLGNTLFKQSIKNTGEISQIDFHNKLKLYLFSTLQQSINYCDNTLSIQQDSYDLSEAGFYDVTLIAASSQQEKIWIYDQNNSRLALLSNNPNQNQLVENVCGLISCTKIVQIQEYENKLYLLDQKNGLYQFDLYGSLLKRWHIAGQVHFVIDNDFAFLLSKENLTILNLSTLVEQTVKLPEVAIQDFQKVGPYFYFKSKDYIYKYKVNLF